MGLPTMYVPTPSVHGYIRTKNKRTNAVGKSEYINTIKGITSNLVIILT